MPRLASNNRAFIGLKIWIAPWEASQLVTRFSLNGLAKGQHKILPAAQRLSLQIVGEKPSLMWRSSHDEKTKFFKYTLGNKTGSHLKESSASVAAKSVRIFAP